MRKENAAGTQSAAKTIMKENKQEGRKGDVQIDNSYKEVNRKNQLDYHLYGLSKRGKIMFFVSICAFMVVLFGILALIAIK